MYIIVNQNPEAPVAISRKLHKALVTGKANAQGILSAISISRIKGTDRFCIIPRKPEDTFRTQCSYITPHPKHDRRTPSVFTWTVPSLEYILHVTGLTIVGSKVIKVKPETLACGITIYTLQT